MPEPQRIQLRRTRGWRKPEGAVVVARPTKWGNPFMIGETLACEDREDAYGMYREWLEYGATAPYPLPGETARLSDLRERVLADIHELIGKDLACWCPLPAPGSPDFCHAVALLDAAEHEAQQREEADNA